MRSKLINNSIRTILVFAIFSFFNFSAAQEHKPLVLTHAVIIDGNGGTPIEDGTIVIKGDKILAVGASSSVDIPSNAEVIDVTGQLGGYNLQWAWSSGYCCGQFV